MPCFSPVGATCRAAGPGRSSSPTARPVSASLPSAPGALPVPSRHVSAGPRGPAAAAAPSPAQPPGAGAVLALQGRARRRGRPRRGPAGRGCPAEPPSLAPPGPTHLAAAAGASRRRPVGQRSPRRQGRRQGGGREAGLRGHPGHTPAAAPPRLALPRLAPGEPRRASSFRSPAAGTGPVLPALRPGAFLRGAGAPSLRPARAFPSGGGPGLGLGPGVAAPAREGGTVKEALAALDPSARPLSGPFTVSLSRPGRLRCLTRTQVFSPDHNVPCSNYSRATGQRLQGHSPCRDFILVVARLLFLPEPPFLLWEKTPEQFTLLGRQQLSQKRPNLCTWSSLSR